MKRWIVASMLLAMVIGSIGSIGSIATSVPVMAQDAPTAGPVREFEVEDGHMIGLSPDGSKYAVAIQATELCVYSAETLEEISCGSIEQLDAGIRFEDVVWSPDSTKLVFAEQGFVFGTDGDLWVMDAQTGTVTNVTDDGYAGPLFGTNDVFKDATFYVDVSPAWTPDSQFITFSRSGWVEGERTGNVLAQVAATGGEVETLATVSDDEPGVVYFRSAWAPDGQTYYFSLTHVEASSPQNGIWSYDKASGAIAQLATGDEADLGPLTLAQVSPDGTQLLAWYPQAFGVFIPDTQSLRLVDTATGTLAPVALPQTDPAVLSSTTTATFSPDGKAMLMLIRVLDHGMQLWVTDLATDTQTMLLDGPEDATSEPGLTPTWGVNGNVAVGHGVGAGYLTSISGIGLDISSATPAAAASPAVAPAQGIPMGGEVRTFDLPDGRAVNMSPDGRWLAEAVLPSEALCIYDTTTTEEVSCADLSDLNAGIRVEDIVWSPDSTLLAFGENAFRMLKDGDLWVMDALSGELTNLTDDGYAGTIAFVDDDAASSTYYEDISPAWTPDGQFITFSRSTFIGNEQQGNIIAQIAVSGGAAETLATVSSTEVGSYYLRGAWSPDGASFFYTVSYPDTEDSDNGIWVLDQHTGDTHLLATSDDAELGPLALKEVSPSGDRLLAYYPNALAKMGYINRSVLRFVDPATGMLSPVPDPAPESEIYGGTWIATFSPDGQYLLQATGIDAGLRDFWATNLSTGVSTKVASELELAIPIEYALGPVWGSNGMVFVSKSIDGAYFFPIEGAGTTKLVPIATPDVPSVASPVSANTLTAGSDVQTIGVVLLFAGPDSESPIVAFLPPHHVVHVLAEPIANDQGTWYPVFDPASQIIGYAEARRLKELE